MSIRGHIKAEQQNKNLLSENTTCRTRNYYLLSGGFFREAISPFLSLPPPLSLSLPCHWWLLPSGQARFNIVKDLLINNSHILTASRCLPVSPSLVCLTSSQLCLSPALSPDPPSFLPFILSPRLSLPLICFSLLSSWGSTPVSSLPLSSPPVCRLLNLHQHPQSWRS